MANDGFLRTGYRQPIAVDLSAFGFNGTIVDVVGPPGYVNGVYTPPDGENGNVAITYAVVNSCRLRASGRVTIDVNQEPVGGPKSITVFRAEPVVVPVTDLATDAEALTITSMTGAPTWVTREASRLVIDPTLEHGAGRLELHGDRHRPRRSVHGGSRHGHGSEPHPGRQRRHDRRD